MDAGKSLLKGWLIIDSLPNPLLFTEPAKIADIICVSEGSPLEGEN
jgi:hypothetical protein